MSRCKGVERFYLVSVPLLVGSGQVFPVAKAVTAFSVPGVSDTVRNRVIVRSWKALLAEGRALPLESPTAKEVRDFYARSAKLVSKHVTNDILRYDLLEGLAVERAQLTRPVDPALFYATRFLVDYSSYTLRRKKSTPSLTIAVDLDGCLYDFTGAMRKWLLTRGWSEDQLVPPTQYYSQKDWNIEQEVFNQELITALDTGDMFRVGVAYPDAIRGVRDLGLAGHNIVINTARFFNGLEGKALAATLLWLREHRVHPDLVHLANPLDKMDKLAVPFDLLIDDHPSNVETALGAGRAAVLLDRDWNVVYSGLPRASYSQIAADPYSFL